MLDEKLASVLSEAKTKTEIALSEATAENQGFEKKVWFAAEAAEFSSLIFSLTYHFQDFDPPAPVVKGKATLELLRDSSAILREIVESYAKEPKNSYAKLRTVVHYLWKAHRNVRKTKLSR